MLVVVFMCGCSSSDAAHADHDDASDHDDAHPRLAKMRERRGRCVRLTTCSPTRTSGDLSWSSTAPGVTAASG